MNLHENQSIALNETISNDFNSGIIAHATGTGKSLTGINIVYEYVKKYSKCNIFWLCEYKSVLDELFYNKNFIVYLNKLEKTHIIFNFSRNKKSDWYNDINKNNNTITFINRAFLTSQLKYQKITEKIDLIIHDECHSIKNQTTTEFYNYFQRIFPDIKIIGLSATPLIKSPFLNIINHYTLYDALCEKSIVNPKIIWFTKEGNLSQKDIMIEVKNLIENLYYKKIIVWCGLINICNELYKLWKEYFSDYTVCIDTSQSLDENNFEKFKNLTEKGILFCAAKHREGSDIKNLDACIFMDKVQKRSAKTFLQCVGRVLRLQKNKDHGLIIDIKAKNAYDIIKRMALYLNNDKTFPYTYNYTYNENQTIKINNLLIKDKNNTIIKSENLLEKPIDEKMICKKFKRQLPDKKIYRERFHYELNLFVEKDLLKYLNFATEILELTQDIPHVTRGSCGSSLLCYLLGITHVDPVEYNIKFERFLNIYRNNLPDIDFDFPHNLRDEIFYRLEKKWPGKIARISNHVHYHEKSAKRAVLKELGYNKFIGKYEIDDIIKKLPQSLKSTFNNKVKNLENKFRMYSLHCGGIVFYPEGVPDYIKHTSKSQNVINQITLNKYDISTEKKFKIDILSSRALTQLYTVDKNLPFTDFESITIDKNVMELFKKGNNIGITLAESPLIRKAMINIEAKNISDLALVLAIIRPAAKDVKVEQEITKDDLVFDDDAIDFLAKYCNIDHAKADYYRRNIAKNNYTIINEIKKQLPNNKKKKFETITENLQGYGFCKAHSYSYAQLIYKLAFIKYHKPKKFWEATIKHCESSYRKWVHLFEAFQCNVDFTNIYFQEKSVYSNNKNNQIFRLNNEEHFSKYGIWNFKLNYFYPKCYGFIQNNIYHFKGLIASIKVLQNIIIYCICIAPNKYIEIIIDNKKKHFNSFKSKGIKGIGKLQDSCIISIKSNLYSFF
jgi:superfamily II DNA or RNA helicase